MSPQLEFLPPKVTVETLSVLKLMPEAHRCLGELKGKATAVPNQEILINTLTLQEAKESSAIENIFTTQDDLFKEETSSQQERRPPAVKEVEHYKEALYTGYKLLKKQGNLTKNHLLAIQEKIKGNTAGFRELPGTELRNNTGEVVYKPPQDQNEIKELMDNLEKFINDNSFFQADPLIKMALIHYQFESIHPFYDGNGRTGRILNILYLVLSGLLDIPILYLSRYINRTKKEYYQGLQNVRTRGAWEDWILYMLNAVKESSLFTLELVEGIQKAMQDYKKGIRSGFKFYSQDLINNLFRHPYTKISFVMEDLKVSRITAAKYLGQLTEGGFLEKKQLGRDLYFVNKRLYNLLES